MSLFGDHQDMSPSRDERLLSGAPVDGEPEVAAFVAALRATSAEPAPAPTAALLAVLSHGLAPDATAPGRTAAASTTTSALLRRRPRASDPRPARAPQDRRPVPPADAPAARRAGLVAVSRWVAGLGVAAKVLLGAGIAAASVGGAASIDAVPDAVQAPAREVVDWVVDAVVPGTADDGPSGAAGTDAPSSDHAHEGSRTPRAELAGASDPGPATARPAPSRAVTSPDAPAGAGSARPGDDGPRTPAGAPAEPATPGSVVSGTAPGQSVVPAAGAAPGRQEDPASTVAPGRTDGPPASQAPGSQVTSASGAAPGRQDAPAAEVAPGRSASADPQPPAADDASTGARGGSGHAAAPPAERGAGAPDGVPGPPAQEPGRG